MKQICVFLVMVMLASCEYFKVKKTSTEAILKEELQTFNWSEVDTYPTFSSCDSSKTKYESERCFEQTLVLQITGYLQNENIIVTQDVHDTIILNLQVSETGSLDLLHSKIDTLTEKEIPNIKALLVSSLDSLPEIFPAIKRGQQVTTQFTLPIIIKVE